MNDHTANVATLLKAGANPNVSNVVWQEDCLCKDTIIFLIGKSNSSTAGNKKEQYKHGYGISGGWS